MRKVFFAFAFFVLLTPAAVLAQAVYGNIVGTVLDPQGAAVANAKVIITDTARSVNYSATTNADGNFTQRFLIAGTYQVRVEAQGFKATVQNVQVSVDQESRADLKLEVGELSQTVEVTSDAPLLKTERSDVAVTFSEKTLTNLPIINRRFTAVEIFSPGVTAFPGQTAASEDPQGSYRKVVNGQSFAGSSHLLDGTDNHDSMLGLIVINPTLESVTEAKVTTANYDAEFGANAGVISSQTRSGTNDFHAVGFEFLRNDHFNARNPFTQFNPIKGTNRYIPVTQLNQYGTAVSGKIIPNKLFWFGDYQGTRRNIGGSVLMRVPTALERAGDFSATGVNIFDPNSGAAPANRTQFAGNKIPTARLSPQALNILNKFVPLPNITGAASDDNNYVGAGAVKFNEDLTNTRWDYYVSEKMHVFGRYSFADYRLISPGVFGSAGGGSGFNPDSTFAGESKTRNQSVAAGFDYTVNANLLTDFRFGFYRYRVNVDPGQAQTTPAKDANIPGLNNDSFTGGLPAFFINQVAGGSSNLNFGYALGVNACNCPLRENERQVQFVNNWTNLRGNHTIKFGADIRRAANLRIPSDRHRAGELTFNAARTSGVGAGNGGSGLAAFLLGDVSIFQRYVSTITDAEERQNRWFFFGQDTWKVNSKLTINYGLRWELYRPQTVTGAGKGGFIDVNTGEVRIAGTQGVGLDLTQKGTLTNIAPRLGIAYRLNEKTVIRMGYGRGFDIGVFGSVFGHNVTQNLPVLGIQSNNPAQNYLSVFTLAAGPTALDPGTILTTQPKGPNGQPILPNGVTAFILPQTLRLPTSDQWNLSIQRQLPGNISVEAAYVGTKGTHVFAGNGGDYDFNQATIKGFVDANGVRTTTNSRKPFFNKFGWSQNFRYYGSDASNNYHGLQLKADKRFSKGFSILSHYTWSRSFNYSNVYYNIDAKEAYGPNDNTRSHVFLLAGVFELPFGKGKTFFNGANKAVDAVLGGWQMNTVWQLQSGLPFTPTYRDCSQDQDTGWCRPDLVGDWRSDNPTRVAWFKTASAPLTSGALLFPSNASAIARAAGTADGPWRRPATGTFGNIGRNRLLGPGLSQVDMSFFKNFVITERLKAQFRAESYNIVNHMNFANPNTCVDCPNTAGRITGLFRLSTPRQWQFGLRLEY